MQKNWFLQKTWILWFVWTLGLVSTVAPLTRVPSDLFIQFIWPKIGSLALWYLKDENKIYYYSVDHAPVHAVTILPVLQRRTILLIRYLISWRRRIAKIYVWIILIVRSILGEMSEIKMIDSVYVVREALKKKTTKHMEFSICDFFIV